MNLAHVHLLLNHTPVLGAIFGLLVLIWGLLRRNQEVIRLSLVVFAAVAVLAIPVFLTGEPAEEHVEDAPGVSEEVIAPHENFAKTSLFIAEITGIVALAGLVAFRKREKMPTWFAATALVLALIVSGFMAQTAYLGGMIRHTEVRPGAPVSTEEEHEDEHENDEDHDEATPTSVLPVVWQIG